MTKKSASWKNWEDFPTSRKCYCYNRLQNSNKPLCNHELWPWIRDRVKVGQKVESFLWPSNHMSWLTFHHLCEAIWNSIRWCNKNLACKCGCLDLASVSFGHILRCPYGNSHFRWKVYTCLRSFCSFPTWPSSRLNARHDPWNRWCHRRNAFFLQWKKLPTWIEKP